MEMPIVKAKHWRFVIMVLTYPAWVIALLLTEKSTCHIAVLPLLMITGWLVIPCNDSQFGNGRKFYWIRQAIISASVVACALIILIKYLITKQ